MSTSEPTKTSKILRFKVLYTQKLRDDPRTKNDIKYLVTKNTFDDYQSIFQKKTTLGETRKQNLARFSKYMS